MQRQYGERTTDRWPGSEGEVPWSLAVIIAASVWAIAALAAGIGVGRVIARADSEESRVSLPAPSLSATARP